MRGGNARSVGIENLLDSARLPHESVGFAGSPATMSCIDSGHLAPALIIQANHCLICSRHRIRREFTVDKAKRNSMLSVHVPEPPILARV